MNIKTLTLTAAATAALFASYAQAAETTSILVEANIPSAEFHFRPVSAINGPQEMNYNLATQDIEDLKFQFSFVKGATSKVTAELDKPALLFDGGTETVGLSVSFDGVSVTENSPADIVAVDEGTSGAKTLTIAADGTAGNYEAGEYTGEVSLTFNAELVTP